MSSRRLEVARRCLLDIDEICNETEQMTLRDGPRDGMRNHMTTSADSQGDTKLCAACGQGGHSARRCACRRRCRKQTGHRVRGSCPKDSRK